jgi:ABC-2 type transport system ATP-binding protein
MSDEPPATEDGVVRVSVRARAGAVVEAVRRLDAAGVGVVDIAAHRPTLDDVFLSLTGHAAEAAAAPDGESETEAEEVAA